MRGCPACLPYGSVKLAVKEVHRVAKMGLKGLELSCSWDMDPKCIEVQFAGLSPEIVHKITCGNAAKFYGLVN